MSKPIVKLPPPAMEGRVEYGEHRKYYTEAQMLEYAQAVVDAAPVTPHVEATLRLALLALEHKDENLRVGAIGSIQTLLGRG